MYEKLDALILSAIKVGRNPLYDNNSCNEAARIATETGRESSRVMDGRIQYLRRAGRILHSSQRKLAGGWQLVPDEGVKA